MSDRYLTSNIRSSPPPLTEQAFIRYVEEANRLARQTKKPAYWLVSEHTAAWLRRELAALEEKLK